MSKIISYYDSPIGVLEIEQTDNYITKILIKEECDIKPRDNLSTELINVTHKQLDEYFAGTRFTFSIPIVQTGTNFQQRVWNQLQKIPYGKTISYNELAIQLGNPKSIRAAGTANGKNQIVILVACHRVIGSDGSLVGYAGGLWRKKWLLEHEAEFAHGVQKLFPHL